MKKETREKMINLILAEVERQKGIWRYIVDMRDINAMPRSYTLFVTADGFGYVDGLQADLPDDLKKLQDAEDEEIQEVFRDVFGRRKLEEVLAE